MKSYIITAVKQILIQLLNTHRMQTEGCQNNVEGKVSVDLKLLKQKQQLLIQYYQLQQEQAIINVLMAWPNQQITINLKENPIIHKTNNARYVGEVCNQMFHGYGLLLYDQPRGRYYEGQFQNNCKHGDGLEFIGGDIYIGKFVNNKPEQQNGVFMWKNGDIYIGGFINGMKHGLGRWQSGEDFYAGNWKLNQPEGLGKIHTSNSEYEGDIKKGYKHGRGKEIFRNGDIYEGSYANGKPQGDGIYKWSNGAVYKGQFKNGIRYGYGQWTFGREKYEGQYVNDRRNGEGIYKWGNQSYYKGQFVDDMRHGFGEMHWSQKAYYKGHWKEGIQSGQGELWEDDELVSKGLFQDGKLIKNQNHPKLLNNRYEQFQKNDSSLRNTKTTKSNQTKYPAIQRRKKLRSNSYYSNLNQIDEKDHSSKSKKQSATTSFSHHIQNNHHQSYARKTQKNTAAPKKEIKQILYLPQKKKIPLVKTPNNFMQKQKDHNRISQKKFSSGKDRIVLPEAELGPIKWRNFGHLNGYKNSIPENSNLPQL